MTENHAETIDKKIKIWIELNRTEPNRRFLNWTEQVEQNRISFTNVETFNNKNF